MEEREAIDLLKHYRHTFSNHIQLIISYAQMGHLDRVQEKSAELIKILAADQQFQNMPLPKTIIMLMQLNHTNSGLDWEPIVEIETKPVVDDGRVAKLIEKIHEQILEQSMNLSLYHGTIKFQQKKDQPFLLEMTIDGAFDQIDQIKEALYKLDKSIQIESATEEALVFNWTAQ